MERKRDRFRPISDRILAGCSLTEMAILLGLG